MAKHVFAFCCKYIIRRNIYSQCNYQHKVNKIAEISTELHTSQKSLEDNQLLKDTCLPQIIRLSAKERTENTDSSPQKSLAA